MSKTIITHPDGTVEIIADPRPIEVQRAERLEQLAARRALAEQAFTFKGVSMRLDDKTQARISSAVAGLALKPEGSMVRWEVSRGVFASFDLPTLQAIGEAVFDHVQACFANVETLTAVIMAADDPSEVDLETGW